MYTARLDKRGEAEEYTLGLGLAERVWPFSPTESVPVEIAITVAGNALLSLGQ